MGVRQTKLPAIPDPTKDNILEVCVALKEVVEVGVLNVKRGDPLDSNVTYRNLYEFGYYGSNTGGAGGSNTTPPVIAPPIGGPFIPPTQIPTQLPGRPANVKTHPVWDAIQVTWDWPTEPNTHWERVAVHASTSKVFNDGNIVGYSSSNFYIHTGVGLSDPAGTGDSYEPGVRWYWVRFEATDLQTGELKATEWSPYNYNDGIMGMTATDITATIENFRLGSSVHPELNSIAPFVVGDITVGYTEGGDAIKELAVGLDGNFLVDGTITARAIQAESIGAREIRAESVWAQLMTAWRVISTQFTTRAGLDFRLEINGEGSGLEFYPLWYGNKETGGDGSLFYIRNYEVVDGQDVYRVSSLFLSGEMYVTGAGKFFGGYVALDEDGIAEAVQTALRIEIGGPDTDFILWAGSGPTGAGGTVDSESQPIFYIDNNGNAVFNGTVEAKFVSGEISRTFIIQDIVKFTNVSNWRTISGGGQDDTAWVLPAPPFSSGHVPYVSFSIHIYGDNQKSSETRLSYKTTPQGDWVVFHQTVHDIFNYGGLRTVTAIVPFRVYQKIWFKLDVAGNDNQTPTFENPRGIIMGIR